MAESVRVEGIRKTVRALEQLGVGVSDLKGAFGEISELGAAAARRYVPVRSGALKASIRPAKSKNRAVVMAGNRRAWYAGIVNYHQGSHYLQKADDEIKPRVLPLIEKNLSELIAKEGLQ